MYNVIVVDDEINTCRSLSKIIEKSFSLFKVVKTFSNGQDALSFIRTESSSIDLVFSDIRMPKLSGLDLLKILHKEFPDITLIIISGYSDFSYARTALQNGATDYLLKPLIPSRVRGVLENVREKLDNFTLKKRTEIIRCILEKEFDDTELLKKYFPEKKYYLAIRRSDTLPRRYVHDHEITLSEINENSYTVQGQDKKETIFIIPCNEMDRGLLHSYLFKKSQKNDCEDFVTMVYYNEVISVQELQKVLHPLLKFLYEILTIGKNQFKQFAENYKFESSEKNNTLISLVKNSVKRGDTKQGKANLISLFDYWKENTPPQTFIENFLQNLLDSALNSQKRSVSVDNNYLYSMIFFIILTLLMICRKNILMFFLNRWYQILL